MAPSRVVGAAILSLLVAAPAAADPVVMDTLGVFDTQVKAYTTSERPPTWVPELKVVIAIEGYAAEDVLVYQLKQGAKKIGAAHTCSSSTSYADKAPTGTIPGVTKELDLVYFDCKPDEKQGISKGGDYQLELSLKQPLSGKEFKAFASLHFNVIVAKQGNHNDPWNFYVHNGDHNLNVSMAYESLVREYGPSDAGRMLSGVVGRASGKVAQPTIPPHVMIRTWFKEGETAMPRTTMSCMYNGKKVDGDDGDYQTESRDYYTFVKKGKDTRFTERWIQRLYTLAKLKFDPPCGWEKFKKSNLSMDQFWLSKNPGEYRCVIMGGGEILKEVFFTVKDGKIAQSPCQSKINTLRQVTLVPAKDTKVSNIKFDKKAGAIGFHRVKWDTGCPPAK
jgi:hypothetical protein